MRTKLCSLFVVICGFIFWSFFAAQSVSAACTGSVSCGHVPCAAYACSNPFYGCSSVGAVCGYWGTCSCTQSGSCTADQNPKACSGTCDPISSCKDNTTNYCVASHNCGYIPDATPTPACTPNCDCAANTCVGQTCRNSCDTADCNGTKVDESVTNCTGTQVQYTETPQTTGTIWAKATGCTWGVTSTAFPTWNSYNGQDDIVWYPGTDQGSGTWQSTINISSHQPALGPTVNVDVYENGVCRPVNSGWEGVGGQTVTLAPKTCAVTINTPGAVSSQTNGINITATGNAHINPGFDTVRAWITRSDMGAIPGGVTYDYGGSPGIAAVLYGTSYYGLSSAYQNSVDAANTSAIFTVHAPPGNYRVHCDLPTDLNNNLVKCSGNPICDFNGGATNCASTGWKDCSSSDWKPFRIQSPPTISNLVIKNSVETPVTAEQPGNRNHICQSSFTTKQVSFEVTLTDPDGWNEISSAQLQWNGNPYTLALGAGLGTSRLGTVTVNYNGINNGGVFEIKGTVSDPYTNIGWVGLGRLWKVWDCQVPTHGSLYEAKDGVPTCSTTSAGSYIDANKIESGVGFNSIIFSNPPDDINLTDNNLNTYGPPNNIVWGKNYLPLINGGIVTGDIDGNLLADVRKTRIIDLGAGTTTCPGSAFTINESIVSAYSASPRAQIDFSFIQDQEAWYQVEGAGVKSRLDLTYGVPVTADKDTTRFLTLGNLINDNGLVSFGRNLTNTNGNTNDNEFGGAPPFKNWYLKQQSTNDLDIYNYNYFYNNFFVKAGVGEIKTNLWGGWATDKKIYFVNSNLDINADLIVPNGQTIMVVVNGDINIASNVNQLDGIYIANGSISTGGTSGTQLVINGMLYARGNVTLNRSFTDKRTNNTIPAVKVNYSPGLIFNLPPGILRVLSGWREE